MQNNLNTEKQYQAYCQPRNRLYYQCHACFRIVYHSFFFLPGLRKIAIIPITEVNKTVASPNVSYALKSSITAVTIFTDPVLDTPSCRYFFTTVIKGSPKPGSSFKASHANKRNIAIKPSVENVLKNHLPSITSGRSLLIVALIRIIRHNISTTSCVIARSGALRTRKARHSAKPTAPTTITLESKSFTSMATIAAKIMNIKSICNSILFCRERF